MNKEKILYLKWIISELNEGLNLNSFTKNIYSPIDLNDIITNEKDRKLSQVERLLIAAEIYRWVMGGKWRLLDLEHMIRKQKAIDLDELIKIKESIKNLIDNQKIQSAEVIKMCLLLTGIKKEIVENAKYIVQKRYFYTGNTSKLWSSIGYYDMKDKSIHVSIGGKKGENKAFFPLEDIIETAAHELGHHIYISLMSGKIKSNPGTLKEIRKIIKNIRTSKNEKEHEQWLKFYKKDYENDWNKNKSLQIIPQKIYVKYGIENELFAQVISGKTIISKNQRKKLIELINKNCFV